MKKRACDEDCEFLLELCPGELEDRELEQSCRALGVPGSEFGGQTLVQYVYDWSNMAFPSDPELALELYLDTLKAVVKSFPTIVDLGAFTRTVLRNIANRIRRESAQKRTTDDGGEGKNVSCDDPDEPELGLNADGTPWRSSQRELSTAEEQVLEDLGTDPEERMQHQDELRGQQEEREEQSLCTAREEFVARVHEAVQQLPESVQRVAEKLYVEGRTPQEAADELQLKPGTFRQYRKRARDGIRARLTERFQGTRIPTILPLDEWLDILLRQVRPSSPLIGSIGRRSAGSR